MFIDSCGPQSLFDTLPSPICEYGFSRCTLSEIASRFISISTEHKHQCTAWETCHLRLNLGLLSSQIQRMVRDVEGISLEAAMES